METYGGSGGSHWAHGSNKPNRAYSWRKALLKWLILAIGLGFSGDLLAATGHGGGMGGGTRGAFGGGSSNIGRGFGNFGRNGFGDGNRFRNRRQAFASSAERDDGHRHRHFFNDAANVYPYSYPYYDSTPYYYNYPYGGYNYSQYMQVPLQFPDTGPVAGSSSAYYGEVPLSDVQAALARLGYYRGQVDGVMGPLTRQAINDFQRDSNLAATGRVTPGVLGRLGLQ